MRTAARADQKFFQAEVGKIGRHPSRSRSTVRQSDLFKHPHKAGAEGVEGFNFEIFLGCGIEEQIEIGFEPVLGSPVANEDRHAWQWT